MNRLAEVRVLRERLERLEMLKADEVAKALATALARAERAEVAARRAEQVYRQVLGLVVGIDDLRGRLLVLENEHGTKARE